MDKQPVTNTTVSMISDESSESSEIVQSAKGSGVQLEAREKAVDNSTNPDKYYWKGFGFVLFLGTTAFSLLLVYMRIHGINAIEAFNNPNYVWVFDFVGGSRNPASIGFEIGIWTFLGVTCRMAYTSTQSILRGQFDWLKSAIGWIGAGIFAWGIAVAVIFSLQVIVLNVGGIEITLANISLEAIIAISFIMGFYNQESRELLDKVRGQIVRGMGKAEQDDEKEAALVADNQKPKA
jgi:hypothetical protein